jgi:O-acetyl-ADP-ribose deacetylase (regulator of RNase III)
LTVFYGLIFPVAFLLTALAFICGGFLSENYWGKFFSSYSKLWNGLPDSSQPSNPAAPPFGSGSPGGSPLSLAPIATPIPDASGTPEQQAAFRHQQQALAAMKAKFDSAEDSQKFVFQFPCADGTDQEVRLFFSIDNGSTRAPTEVLVNAANESMTGPAGGINAAIYNLYGPSGWRKAADFPTGKVLSPGEVCFHSGPTMAEDPDAQPTVAVNRPAYVCQALGPNLRHGKSCTAAEKQQLKNCYENIVGQGWRRGVHSFTLCNISTAIFSFPKKKAAKIAVSATARTARMEAAKMPTARTEPIYIWFAQFSNDSVAHYQNEFAKLKAAP